MSSDTDTIEGLKAVAAGEFGELTKLDTLRVIAASHVILAVVLIGIISLSPSVGMLD